VGTAGHEVAFGEHVLRVGEPAAGATAPAAQVAAPAPRLVEGTLSIGVHGPGFHVTFSRIFNGLTSYRFGETRTGGRELLSGAVTPNFWHAPTANERGWGGPFEEGSGCSPAVTAAPAGFTSRPTSRSSRSTAGCASATATSCRRRP
jgi:beta-galactosidase